MKRFLLISDLHACTDDPSSSSATSYVSTFSAGAKAALDPLTDLERLIKEEGLVADYVLCPGDVTDRSNPTAFTYAWGRLVALSGNLGAKLVATVGNHDIDSRFKENSFDPRGYVMSLTPTVPTNDRTHFLEFWAENFTFTTCGDTNIIVLNTAAYHGGGKDVADEIEHGRISEVTLKLLKKALARGTNNGVNVLLCHHQLIKSGPGDDAAIKVTRGGEELIAALDQANAAWIVVHGHKHVPDIFYGHGGSNSPVIMSCASFSAQINADSQNKNPNQVHLLVCDPAGARAEELTSAGYVLTWTWQPGVGWKRSLPASVGLPYYSGFGYRGSVPVLAEKIDAHLRGGIAMHVKWTEAVEAVPSLARLVPTNFERFESELRAKGISILTDRDGSLAQIGRSA